MSESNQPDFRGIWKNYFSQQADGVQFNVRLDSNFQHDVVFLSSLLHDARVNIPVHGVAGGEIKFSLNRDCWERGYTEKPEGLELHVADSVLQISGVLKIETEFPSAVGEGELWLDYLWIDEDYRLPNHDGFTLSMVGSNWRVSLIIEKEKASIRLADLEPPYIYSERHGEA